MSCAASFPEGPDKCRLQITITATVYRVFQKNRHKVLHVIHFEPLATESCSLHIPVICINGSNILKVAKVVTHHQWCHLQVSMALVTTKGWWLMKTTGVEEGWPKCWQNDCWVSSKTTDCSIWDAFQHMVYREKI